MNDYVNACRITRDILICGGVGTATKTFIVVASVFGCINNSKMDAVAKLVIESSKL